MKTGSCSICIRLHEIYAVNITGIKRYHTTWMKKRILQGAGDDEPASSGNESCGIPCLPVVLYREMDLGVGRVSIAVHYMDQGLGSTVICILSSAYFAVAPALFSQLYEERMTVFWAAAFALTACSLAGNLRERVQNMEEPVWN